MAIPRMRTANPMTGWIAVSTAAAAMPIGRVLLKIRPSAQAVTNAVVRAMVFSLFCEVKRCGEAARQSCAAKRLALQPSPQRVRYWFGGTCHLFLSCCFERVFPARTPDLNSNEPRSHQWTALWPLGWTELCQ